MRPGVQLWNMPAKGGTLENDDHAAFDVPEIDVSLQLGLQYAFHVKEK